MKLKLIRILNSFRLSQIFFWVGIIWGLSSWSFDFNESVHINYSDLVCKKAFQGDQSLGGGALVLKGIDRTTGVSQGGAYLVYDGRPSIQSDRGAIALYPIESNLAASLSIAPSGMPAELLGEDASSLALQLQNGFGSESRFVAVMKKWGEMRFATISTGDNSTVIPMVFYVGPFKLIELTKEGQVNLFHRGKPVMTMDVSSGIPQWQVPQHPLVFASIDEVRKNQLLGQTQAGTEISFKDKDGRIKKAIKQENGKWLRVNDLKALW